MSLDKWACPRLAAHLTITNLSIRFLFFFQFDNSFQKRVRRYPPTNYIVTHAKKRFNENGRYICINLFSRKYSYLLGSCNFKYCYVFCVDLPLMMKTVSSRPKFVESSNCHVTKSGCYVLSFFPFTCYSPKKELCEIFFYLSL